MRPILLFSAPLLVAVALIIAVCAGDADWSGLEYKRDILTAGTNAATALFIVAAFLERSMAVINALLFAKEKKIAEAAVLAADSPTSAGADHLAEERLATIEAHEERVRVGLGFLAATVISAAGSRSLTALMAPPASESQQHTLFLIADILLTAGLLAGGSNGLAALIKILGTQMKVSLRNLRKDLSRPA